MFTATIGWWAIPFVLSLPAWIWAICTPAKPPGGYVFIPDPMPLVRGVVALVIMLAVWLAYFAVLAL